MPTIGDLIIKLRTDLAGMEAGFDRAESDAQRTASAIENAFEKAGERISTVFRELAAPAIAAFSIHGLEQLMEHSQSLVDLGERWDVAPAALAKLELAANRGGSSLEAATHGAERLAQELEEIGHGRGKAAQETLDKLGLSWQNLQAESPMRAMLDVLEAVEKKGGTATERIALLKDLLGRAGAELALIADKLKNILPGETPSNAALGASARGAAALERGRNATKTAGTITGGLIVEGIEAPFRGPNAEFDPKRLNFGRTPMRQSDIDFNHRMMAAGRRMRQQAAAEKASRDREALLKQQDQDAEDQAVAPFQSFSRGLERRAAIAEGANGLQLDLADHLKSLEGKVSETRLAQLRAEGEGIIKRLEAAEAAAKDADAMGKATAAADRQAESEHNRQLAEAQRLWDAVRLPAEKYRDALEKIDKLLKAGALTPDQAGRVGLGAQNEFLRDYGSQHRRPSDLFAGADIAGSAEAYRQYYATIAGGTGTGKDAALAEAQKQTKDLDEIRVLMERIASKDGGFLGEADLGG